VVVVHRSARVTVNGWVRRGGRGLRNMRPLGSGSKLWRRRGSSFCLRLGGAIVRSDIKSVRRTGGCLFESDNEVGIR
jgi:hypothetical protein